MMNSESCYRPLLGISTSLTVAVVSVKTIQMPLSLQKFTEEVEQPAARGLAIHSREKPTFFPPVAPKVRNILK